MVLGVDGGVESNCIAGELNSGVVVLEPGDSKGQWVLPCLSDEKRGLFPVVFNAESEVCKVGDITG